MSSWSNDFLDKESTPHSRVSSLPEGERSLCELARVSEIEYAWEFDPIESAWHYNLAANQIKNITAKKGIVTGVKVGLELSALQCIPRGESSTFYHIHPTVSHELEDKKFAETFPVQSQIPSSEDFETFVRLSLNGYTHFKIATAIGITAVNFDKKRAEGPSGNILIEGIRIPLRKVAKSVESGGTVHAIHSVFDQLNEHYDGKFELEFEPIQL